MGLFDFVSKQFIDVIEWVTPTAGVLAYRYPMADQEIQNGAKLVVRETQQAMFLNEGIVADTFVAGTHTLTTKTLPLLTNLKNWDKLFQSPFKSDVYFFNKTEQLDQKWGTTQPITVRDKEFGAIRIRAFGNYAYRLDDVAVFWRKLCGTSEAYTIHDLDGQLRAIVMTALATALGGQDIAFVDMAANQQALSTLLQASVAPALADYGLVLTGFNLQSVSLPEELERHLDRASSMRIVGDLQQYTQFQTAEAIPLMAENPSGLAGVGASMAMGLAMGQNMMQQMTPPAAPSASAPKAEDPFVLLEKLAGLKDKGILTQAEFDAKKIEILNNIR